MCSAVFRLCVVFIYSSQIVSCSNVNNSNKTKNKVNSEVPKISPFSHEDRNKDELKMITPDLIQKWADEISKKLYEVEHNVVRREELIKTFSNMNFETRNGTAIVENVAAALEDLMESRAQAAENIMRQAEKLSQENTEPPVNYTFFHSVHLNEIKEKDERMECKSLDKLLHVHRSGHFDADVSMDNSSVYVASEVYDCNPEVLSDIYWSDGLTSTFKENYRKDASLAFQYFCSAQGFLRHYPGTYIKAHYLWKTYKYLQSLPTGATWESMFKIQMDIADVYDCRLRPWYVSAGGAPRDVLILLDASGSMENSSNKIIAQEFTLAMLSALTDDDQVNVLRFNVELESPINCFNDRLVSANHVNSAAMMSALRTVNMTNETWMEPVLTEAVGLLEKQRYAPDRPNSCQQAIVLVTDSLYDNFTEKMMQLDPEGRIRLFVLWLHDPRGLRDNTREYGEWLSCTRDGYFAEMITSSDVTQQVLAIMRVLERPLVAQRAQRLRIFSDVYAHVEDPRRSEFYWTLKENWEQAHRYRELRKNKERLLSPSQLYADYMHQYSLENFGQYYEGVDVNYRLQISVSVPVFDSTTSENITVALFEYPVNRLLGVAGVDIPLDHLKLILPYYQLGGGGSLILLDHRGNVVLHENIKPTFDGDILKPGYRTVDFLDLEQPAVQHQARTYPKEWLDFRKELIVDKASGNRTMHAKYVLEDGMRVEVEARDYHWRRVMDYYTAVVVLHRHGRRHLAPGDQFTQKLAGDALRALAGTKFTLQPDWLYCRFVETPPPPASFPNRTFEALYFMQRRRDEPNFPMRKLEHLYTAIEHITLMERTYQCDEKLMASVCRDAVATEAWARAGNDGSELDCVACSFGSITVFFATESGLTRWHAHQGSGAPREPAPGGAWPRTVREPWYVRAAAAPDTLVVHAPLAPAATKRVSYERVPSEGARAEWMTAARTVSVPNKGVVGVAGYHFYPSHLEELFENVINPWCAEDGSCEARCDGKDWSCFLVDEGGWIVAGGAAGWRDNASDAGEGAGAGAAREHLATARPDAMRALLRARVFKIDWLHDYQAVCFPPKDEILNSAAANLPSVLNSFIRSATLFLQVVKEAAILVSVLSYGGRVAASTRAEKEKRRNRIRSDYETEKFERLYDDRVLVNRTRFAACDRSRAIYILQRTPRAVQALRRAPELCAWPLAGALVPATNLVLLALCNRCPGDNVTLPDPLANEPVDMSSVDSGPQPQSSASRLACWRNRVQLPERVPHTTCYPHQYQQEAGYRQCGPWLPDDDNSSRNTASQTVLTLVFIAALITWENL